MRFLEDRVATVAFGDARARAIHLWEPAGVPAAVAVAIHGGLSHAGDYINLASALRQTGFATVARELPGHGCQRTNGDPRTVHIRRFEEFPRDCESLFEWVVDRYPDRPLFVVGHSMGALIAAHLALGGVSQRFPIRGFVLSAPYFGNALPVSLPLLKLSSVLSAIAPRMRVPIEDFSRFLTHDDAEFRRIERDRGDGLRTPRATVRFAHELLLAQQTVAARIEQWTDPVIAFVAGQDRIADSAISRELLERIDPTKLTFRDLPNSFHEIFNESNREEVFAQIVRWMRVHLV